MRPLAICLVMTSLLTMNSMPLNAQEMVYKNDATNATLVELYSSEGCSSCPPAEAWISTLKDSPRLWRDLFPVAFHVDYWDGLGWPDRFAKPAYTQRQRSYAAQLGQDSVYTPEFVVSGLEWRGWFDGGRIPSAKTGTRGSLTLSVVDGGKNVSALYAPSSAAHTGTFTINVALLGMNVVSDIKRGENGGRQLTHDFVVLDFTAQPMERGTNFQSGPMELKSSTNDSPGAVVAWVSDEQGSIVQIAGGWLKSPPSSEAMQ